MDESDNRGNYIFVLLFTIIFTVFYFIYLYIISKYIFTFYKTKKLSILWLPFSITYIIYLLSIFIYLIFILFSKGKNINIFNNEQNGSFIILVTIFLFAIVCNSLNNLIYNSIISSMFIKSIYQMINIKTLDSQVLFSKLKYIRTNFLEKIHHIFFFVIMGIINIGLIIALEFEYINYNSNFLVKNYLLSVLKYCYFVFLIVLIIFIILLNFFKKKLLNNIYYNSDLFAMKIYNMFYQKILFSYNIISYKIVIDLIINFPILIFFIFKVNNILLWISSEFLTFIYILIFGALIFKLDKFNEVRKIQKTVKIWFFLKNINFCFFDNSYKYCLNDITYKYSKGEIEILKDLKLIEDESDNKEINNNDKIIINDDMTASVIRENLINMDKISIRETEIKERKNKTLYFNTVSELYVLYKLLMLFFEKNQNVYSKVQNEINEEGTPFKQFYTHQNIMKNKRKKARQTFGGKDVSSKKEKFISNIDRMSRISNLNSSNLNSSMTFTEKQIFFSLEEKELKEDFKAKYNNDKDIVFKIESLTANTLFELFPFYQMSIEDIKRALYPSDNKKIHELLINQKNKNINNNNIEIESENNLFYTFNSLLMMELYDPDEFITFKELSKFVSQYGNYLLETIKNINFTFIPLIIGVFNIEIGDESKIVILYRNPLFFTNFNHFNHWINFYITEGPEKIKASIIQNEVIDINEIEIKNSLKMNEADYEEIINNLKRDFDFFIKMQSQVYPIIHLFIGDENEGDANINNINVNESSLMENTSMHQANLSGLLNITDDGIMNNKIIKFNPADDTNYKTESNSIIDKEYYSFNGHDIHTIKIYFTHFFRLNCELNKQKDIDDNMKLKSNHYCQYLEGQIQTYLTKTSLFEIEDTNNTIF